LKGKGEDMQTALKKQVKKSIDILTEEKVKVVLDFIGYLQSKESVPNALTIKTFKKTDSGRDVVKCKNADDMFQKLGI
jgi:antitoxin component of RelBE/YafQ-DinJ toxin-antitoxin module